MDKLEELQMRDELRMKEINTLSRRIDELTARNESIEDRQEAQREIKLKQDERLNRHHERLEGITNELANQASVNVSFRDRFAEIAKQLTEQGEQLDQTWTQGNHHRDNFGAIEMRINELTTKVEEQLQSAATEREMLEANCQLGDATLTDFTDWCDKADYTLQRLTDRLSDVEEKVYENSFTPDVTAAEHPPYRLAQMRHHSREMYIALELVEGAHSYKAMNTAFEAVSNVLRKVRGNEE